MPIFLFVKQFVDMFYQFQILDYGMVIFALSLLVCKAGKERLYLNIWTRLYLTDYIVVALGCVYTASFLRYPEAYGTFFKVMSCFVLYFLGRFYVDEVLQNGKVLAIAGYIVIYVNFAYRFYQFGYKFFVTGPEVTLLNAGGLYYYKTDLAVGIIIATLFIYIFSKKRLFCWLTILPVTGYMVFYSGARMQQLVLVLIYLLILIKELENRLHRRIVFTNVFFNTVIVLLIIIPLVFFIGLQFFPFEILSNQVDLSANWTTSALERFMHSRQIVWWDVLHFFSEEPIHIRLFGIDLQTEYMHNAAGVRAHSAYIKQLYATGYMGCCLFIAFVCTLLKLLCKEKNRELVYLFIGLWIMLMGSGISIESLESTQMSWFPMLFAGVVVSRQVNGMERRNV